MKNKILIYLLFASSLIGGNYFTNISVSVHLSGFNVSGVISYQGAQTKTVYVNLKTSLSSPSSSTISISSFSSPSPFEFNDVLAGTWWIDAFMDVNENGVYDGNEPYGSLQNPLSVSSSVSGITINLNTPPEKPVCSSPNGEINTLSPQLVSSPFSDLDQTDTQTASMWEIFLSSQTETDTPIFRREMNLSDMERFPEDSFNNLKIPWGTLKFGQEYKWRVKYKDLYGPEWSEWSEFALFSTPSSDPELSDQIPSETEIAYLDDTYQVDTGIKTVNGDTAGIKTDKGKITMVKSINPDTLPDDGKPSELPFGLFATRIDELTEGETVILNFYISGDWHDTYWYKFDPVDGWIEYPYATLTYNSDTDYTEIQITLVDGGNGDCDGVANGVIVDPAGIGFSYQKGDVNKDKLIDISDVILILRQAVELDPPDISLADVNGDGEVDISDVILTLRKAVGLD